MSQRTAVGLIVIAIYVALRFVPPREETPHPRPAPMASSILSMGTTPAGGNNLETALGIASLRLDPEQRRMFIAYMDTHGIHTNSEAQNAFMKLAASGLLRLDDAALIQRSLLIDRVLERVTESECAQMVRGGVLSAGLLERFAQVLGADTAAEFVSLGTRAAFAEIEGTPARRVPSEREIRQSVRPVLDQLSSRAASRLLDAVSDLPNATDTDACWSVHNLYHSVTVLPVQQAGRLARMLAIPPTWVTSN